MVDAFLWKIQKHLVRHNVEDRMIWTFSRNGKFSVKAFYSFLVPGGSKAFLVNVVWNP